MWVEARRCCWVTTVLGTGVACGCELLLCGLQTKLGCSERIASTLNNWTISPAKSKADLLLLFCIAFNSSKKWNIESKDLESIQDHSTCWYPLGSWYPWSVLQLQAMLKSIIPAAIWIFDVHADNRNHVEVYGPCCLWPLWARKLLLWWYQWLQIHRLRDIGGFCDNLSAPETKQKQKQENKEIVQRGIYWRKSLKIVIKMLKSSSSQLMASPEGGVEKDLIIFKGLVTGSWSILQWVNEQHTLDLMYIFFEKVQELEYLGVWE